MVKKESVSEKKVITKWQGGVGRRKTAVASVRLWLEKSGNITVNGKAIEDYFSSPVERKTYLQPFEVVDRVGAFSGTIKVQGGGRKAQVQAVRHGIARALLEYDSEGLGTLLKKHSLLTRDSREKERRKYGLAGKARKKKPSPKR